MNLAKKILLVTLLSIISVTAFAADVETSGFAEQITSTLETALAPTVSFLAFLFLGASYEIFGATHQITIFKIPFLVLWLIAGGLFFTFKLRFVNLRLFKHGIDVVRGKYDNPKDPGRITHAQALFTAVAATVGLGNIAGVAIAISIGGPGAVIWMMMAAFLGMSTKFAEVTLGQKYRRFDQNGHLLAGPFYYLRDGLKAKGLEKFGKILGWLAAVLCIAGAVGAGLMFQANQAVAIIADSFGFTGIGKLILVLAIAVLIGIVLIGGIKRIAQITEKIVPIMAIIYVTSCIIILLCNYENVGNAVLVMFNSAFGDNALYGGIIGAIVQGIKRSAFSNEAGLGSAPIAHAAAKTSEPVREGCVSILEPFIDTVVICFMTGIVITVTGVYQGADLSGGGVLITRDAFATVSSWFPYILSLSVVLFAFSTMLTYSYYGQQAWLYLTKDKNINICYAMFMVAIIIGGMINLSIVIDFADILFLSMAVPNLLGMYIMSGDIKAEMDKYVAKMKRAKNL